VCPSRVSFKDFCVVAKVMIIQKNSLAKFGYILDMIVDRQKKKKKNPSIFLATYLLELIIKIWGFGNFSVFL
jgi:hypothetical protein